MQQSVVIFAVLLFSHCSMSLGQLQSPAEAPVAAPPAKAPAKSRSHSHSPPAPAAATIIPTDTLSILIKAAHFSTFVRLIKATQFDKQLYSQLNSSTDGITMFAPNDAAFSYLKGENPETLGDREKLTFMQFHVLPRFLNISDFQTLSNPVKTLAGSIDRFPVTITTSNDNVNITSALSKTSIIDTVYMDKQVAIYEVDRVLIPSHLFPPVAAPTASEKPADAPISVTKDASGALVGSVVNYGMMVSGLVMVSAAVL